MQPFNFQAVIAKPQTQFQLSRNNLTHEGVNKCVYFHPIEKMLKLKNV